MKTIGIKNKKSVANFEVIQIEVTMDDNTKWSMIHTNSGWNIKQLTMLDDDGNGVDCFSSCIDLNTDNIESATDAIWCVHNGIDLDDLAQKSMDKANALTGMNLTPRINKNIISDACDILLNKMEVKNN